MYLDYGQGNNLFFTSLSGSHILRSKMARWDEILSLPVQNPPTLEFSSSDLVWSKVEGWRDNIDRLALIPFTRVDDFVRGESNNKHCPTRFHVEARRRRPPKMTYKPKVDGILEYILYWCSFGPDDHRKGGIVRPSRTTYVPKNKSAGRPNTKRGCTCHFIVKRLIAEPSVALIIYNQDKHVDKQGLPCHGPQDKKAAGTRAMYAPYISEDLRLRVLSLLYVGVSVETIMQRHNESVERQGGPSNRDDLLTHRYVRRQERSIRRSTYELDADDAVSISMWVESHQSLVFFYKDFSDSEPFVLGIQTEWQLQQLIRFGNRRLLASDSKFGSNKLKYPIHSLVVFNSDNKAIPVAWIISPRFAREETQRWMRALHNRVRAKDPTWKLAGFIVDDPLADVLALREVFECSVLICFWRVRHAWHKNLLKRCSEMEVRAEIAKRLGQSVNKICKGPGTADMFKDFMEDFAGSADFMDYFKAIWYPRLGMWATALKTLPLASLETCAAMEFYHNQLRLRLLNEKDQSVYHRADWLVNKLGTQVHSYFWLDEYSGKDDFARYWKDEWMSGLTAWRKSLKIPDSNVVMEVWVQMQLNAQIGPESCQFKVNPMEQQISKPIMDNQDRDLVHKDHCANRTMSSHIENGSAVKRKRSLSNDLGSDPTSENVDAGMEVHSSSNCTPAPQLTIDLVESTGLFSRNGYILGDAGPDIEKNLPSTGAAFNNPDGSEDDTLDKNNCASVMQLEPQPIDDSLSTTKFLDQYANTCQFDESKGGTGLPINSDTSNVKHKMNNTSSSASRPVHSPLVDITDTSDDSNENGAIDSQNVNVGTNNGLVSSSCMLNTDSEIDGGPSVLKSVARKQTDLDEGLDVVERDKKMGNEYTNMTVDVASLDNTRTVDFEHNTSGDIAVHDARTADTSAMDVCPEAVGDL
ncbi:zinc ion binding [Abeliophyllum distichum]|uniref:Zinc ion binding n=1 Tax=Abeliophyllum distichum TaxID=126358 RepID=A0ABD1NW42_9LAMI